MSSLVIQDAVCSTVSNFNYGNISVQKRFDELDIPIGHFTTAQLATDDWSWLYLMRQKSLDSIKQTPSRHQEEAITDVGRRGTLRLVLVLIKKNYSRDRRWGRLRMRYRRVRVESTESLNWSVQSKIAQKHIVIHRTTHLACLAVICS